MKLIASLSRRFRRERMKRLLAFFPIDSDWRVLDVGGTVEIWALSPVRPKLVLLNTPRATETPPAGVQIVMADGLSVPFADQTFDLVFSNSVIEHVGDSAAQAQFAREIQRVGKRHWVQTPDRAFPVEPHLWTPFLHFLPARLQRLIAPRFSVWSIVSGARPDQREYYIDHCLNTVRLLSSDDMSRLFPRSQIIRERFWGLSKSLIAAGGQG